MIGSTNKKTTLTFKINASYSCKIAFLSVCMHFFLNTPLMLTAVTSSRRCNLIKQAPFRLWELIVENALPQLYSIFVQVEFFPIFHPGCFSESKSGFDLEAKWWCWFPMSIHWCQVKHMLASLSFPLWGHIKWSLHCL